MVFLDLLSWNPIILPVPVQTPFSEKLSNPLYDFMTTSQNRQLLIIGSVWPEPDSSAAGERMMQLIGQFRSADYEITFASPADEGRYAADLGSEGVQKASIKMNDSGVDRFLHALQPDVVLFDRFITEEQFGWRAAEQCPHALRILDTEDLHCLRRTRRKTLEEERDFVPEDLLDEEAAKREIASIYRCDLSLIISDYELKLLQDLFEIDKALLHYLPFMLDSVDKDTARSWPAFDERQHFVTIGNFRHAPNWDSVRYLKTTIWPLIRGKLPQAELHIYGAYPPKKAQNLHQPEAGFYIEGRAGDARIVMQNARVCLAPLRFGAGLKGKLIKAMQNGTPSVTTPVGAEGTAGAMPWSGVIAQKPEELAAAAAALYGDKGRWQEAQQHGIEIINQRFAERTFGPALMKRIDGLQDSLGERRSQNFTGAMLMHHTAASTKYMARWIEAKNG
jgi:glycosyltransferase involved in cell wall biosynthesis